MMNCILSVKIFLASIFLGLVSGEVWYEARFTESVLSCEDFNNEVVKADGIKMGMLEAADDEEPAFGLNGPLVVGAPIDGAYNVKMNIFKATELGDEYMFESIMKFCDSIEDTDAPWWPIFQMMNITSCPIDEGSYELKNLQLSIDAFSELLCRDFCGEYSIELSMIEGLDKKVSCHLIQVAIVEHEKDDE